MPAVEGKHVDRLEAFYANARSISLRDRMTDPIKVDPKHYKVEFENDKVRVLRIKYGPNEKSVMHKHPEAVGIFLNDQQAKFTYPDGRTEKFDMKKGASAWFPAVEHLPENVGKNPIELIFVELKK